MAKNREQILALAKRRYVEVDGIRLQNLTEWELSALESRWAKRFHETQEMHPDMRRELLVMCIVDDEGNRVFDNAEVELLKDFDGGVGKRLYLKCREHCGMDDDYDVDKLVKKSSETEG